MRKTEDKSARTYLYPNVYFLIGLYSLGVLVAIMTMPFGQSNTDAMLLTGLVSLSILVISLVAGPVKDVKSVENKWLRDAAASSFATIMFTMLLTSFLSALNILDIHLAFVAVLAIATFDFISKLIIAKKRDS